VIIEFEMVKEPTYNVSSGIFWLLIYTPELLRDTTRSITFPLLSVVKANVEESRVYPLFDQVSINRLSTNQVFMIGPLYNGPKLAVLSFLQETPIRTITKKEKMDVCALLNSILRSKHKYTKKGLDYNESIT